MEKGLSGGAKEVDEKMNEPQVELLELIANEIEKSCSLSLSLDELPPDGGLYAEWSAGYVESLYYNKKAIRIIPLLILTKSIDQKKCLNDLCKICNYLHSLKQYPQGKSVAWKDATTATEPNKVGRQEDGQYIYSCIINIECYF